MKRTGAFGASRKSPAFEEFDIPNRMLCMGDSVKAASGNWFTASKDINAIIHKISISAGGALVLSSFAHE